MCSSSLHQGVSKNCSMNPNSDMISTEVYKGWEILLKCSHFVKRQTNVQQGIRRWALPWGTMPKVKIKKRQYSEERVFHVASKATLKIHKSFNHMPTAHCSFTARCAESLVYSVCHFAFPGRGRTSAGVALVLCF